jgi:putative inorganic carbon (HCO3(-)) transporter
VESNHKKGQSNFLYYGLLTYTAVFYSKIGRRFTILGTFRIELIIGSVILFVILLKILRGEIDFKENRLNMAAIIFLFAAFLTIPFAFVRSVALDWFIRLLKFFAIYPMIIAAINNEDKLKGFIYVYVAMLALLIVEPFILSLQGKGFIWNNNMWRLAGVTGYFSHPNQLGGITSENLPFLFFLFKGERSIIKKLILAVLIIIALRVIMLTQSRTAFVGVLTFAFFLWIYSRRKILYVIVLIFLIIPIWHFSPQQTKERFLTLKSSIEVLAEDTSNLSDQERVSAGSMASRWELIKRGLIAFTENPFLGLGLHCFNSFNGRRWGYWFPPHNTYVQALSEMGIIGFAAFLSVIIFTIGNLRKSREILRKIEGEGSFLFDMSSAAILYIFTRLVVGMFGQDLYGNYWWLAGGLSLVIWRLCKIRVEREKEKAKSIILKYSSDD